MAGQEQDEPLVSAEDKARIERAAQQMCGTVNFMRWAANFRRDEIRVHPSHKEVFLLSAVQSGRFSFAVDGDTIMLGVQSFEEPWAMALPFDAAYVSDRLYLSLERSAVMDAKLLPMSIGLFIDEESKRAQLRSAKYVQPVRVSVDEGRVINVGRPNGLGFPIKEGDVVKELRTAARERVRTNDLGRWF